MQFCIRMPYPTFFRFFALFFKKYLPNLANNAIIIKQSRRSDGIGRRDGLKIHCTNPTCGFESRLRHQRTRHRPLGLCFFVRTVASVHTQGTSCAQKKRYLRVSCALVHVPLGRSGRIFRHRRQNLVPPPLRLSARLSPEGSRLVHSARQGANRLRPALAKNAAPWRFLNSSRPPSAPYPNKTNRTIRFVLFYMRDCFGIGFRKDF